MGFLKLIVIIRVICDRALSNCVMNVRAILTNLKHQREGEKESESLLVATILKQRLSSDRPCRLLECVRSSITAHAHAK